MGAIARFFEPFHPRRMVSLVRTRGTDSPLDEEIKREAAADVEEIEQDDKYFAPETREDRDDLLSGARRSCRSSAGQFPDEGGDGKGGPHAR
jgi:hypothetical protein